jgi:[ribosomal protein S5]-alanine N-acetyltransferase
MIQTLKTPRVNIRPAEPRDARFRQTLLSQPGEILLFGADPYPSEKHAQQHIAGFINMNKTGFSYHWTIERKDSGKAIGFCDVFLPAPHLLPLKTCGLSYGLVHTERRQGLMRETLNTCLDFILNTEGFFRVEATVLLENKASLALLESLGFQQEGIQRKKWSCAGTRHDVISLALLKEEFHLPSDKTREGVVDHTPQTQ